MRRVAAAKRRRPRALSLYSLVRPLRRAASLVEGKRLTLVKASSRRRHLLFDVPVIGPGTIEVMIETNTTALAVDAGRTLMLDKEELLAKANAAKIAIVGMESFEGEHATLKETE